MTISVRKCDRGVPLPEGSHGTFFTWDTWDDEEARSISSHREKDDAVRAADCMNDQPLFRELLEHATRGGGSHTKVLEALVSAFNYGLTEGLTEERSRINAELQALVAGDGGKRH